jgi:hypothetical protein
MGIHYCGAGVLAHHLGCGAGLESAVPNSTGILVEPERAMRVVSKEVGFHQVIDDRSDVFRPTSGGFKEVVSDLPEDLRLKAGHDDSFLFELLQILETMLQIEKAKQ